MGAGARVFLGLGNRDRERGSGSRSTLRLRSGGRPGHPLRIQNLDSLQERSGGGDGDPRSLPAGTGSWGGIPLETAFRGSGDQGTRIPV